MKKLSILIPVYNAEKELGQCLDSILPQLTEETEMILIDDGSRDQSWQILQEYKDRYPEISISHQENQGCTATRKHALARAQGKYSWFFDDDDRIEPDTLPVLLSYLDDDPDILIFRNTVDFVEENYSFEMNCPDKVYDDPIPAIEDCFRNDSFNTYWNKFYRTSILKDHPECLPEGKENSGDLIFNCVAFTYAKKIISTSLLVYHYQKRARETMVNRFLPDSVEVLKDKEAGVQTMMDLLQDPRNPLIDNYLLREYEVFVINLFADGSPYTREEKINMVQEHVLTPRGMVAIQNAEAPNTYSRIFKRAAVTFNARKIVDTYTVLSTAKNTFGGLYRQFRKMTYLKK